MICDSPMSVLYNTMIILYIQHVITSSTRFISMICDSPMSVLYNTMIILHTALCCLPFYLYDM